MLRPFPGVRGAAVGPAGATCSRRHLSLSWNGVAHRGHLRSEASPGGASQWRSLCWDSWKPIKQNQDNDLSYPKAVTSESGEHGALLLEDV